MTKFYVRNEKDLPEEDRTILEGEQVKEYTKIETQLGEATIAPNNWIFTTPDGDKFGVSNSDIGGTYLTDEDLTITE